MQSSMSLLFLIGDVACEGQYFINYFITYYEMFYSSSVFDLSVHKLLGRFTKLKLNLSRIFSF